MQLGITLVQESGSSRFSSRCHCLTSPAQLTRFAVPGINSILLSGTSVQLGSYWYPQVMSITITPFRISCHSGHCHGSQAQASQLVRLLFSLGKLHILFFWYYERQPSGSRLLSQLQLYFSKSYVSNVWSLQQILLRSNSGRLPRAIAYFVLEVLLNFPDYQFPCLIWLFGGILSLQVV